MKISELFEATAPKTEQGKQDTKFMRYLNNLLLRVTKQSMKAGDVRWWMKSPTKLVIETDRYVRETFTDEKVRDFGGLVGVKDFFKRHGLESAKKPAEPRIKDRPIYDSLEVSKNQTKVNE